MKRDSATYEILRWAYRPVKHARQAVGEVFNTARRKKVLADYLARPGFKALNIGCGTIYMDGWLNTDLAGVSRMDFAMDITRPLPLPDASLDAIYGEEVIEHIPRSAVPGFLREACRVLRPGGVLRLTTPDVTEICRIYLGQRDDMRIEDLAKTWLEGEFSKEIWVNAQFQFWGHQFIWSGELLSKVMRECGFGDARRCAPHETHSSFGQLGELERRYGKDAPPWVFASTMVLEGYKAPAPSAGSSAKSSRDVALAT